jgi:SNF2 family DNA or RNA helicase
LFAEALTKISYLKQVVLKNKDVSGVLRDFLEEKEKIVVFSQYKWKIKELQEEFSDIAVSLTGDTPIDDRQNIIDDFYNNPKIKLFLSTIRAGGVGINLVCADTVVFTDLSWTPADLLQAEDRLLRIGQKNNVNVYYLITPKTI